MWRFYMSYFSITNKKNLILSLLSIALIMGLNIGHGDLNGLNNTVNIDSDIRISHIQGDEHESPLFGHYVSNVPGVVTVITSNGFYMQNPDPDRNLATSEGIFVFTANDPDVNEGDFVLVDGFVYEYKGGTYSLGGTQIISKKYIAQYRDNISVGPTVIGAEGRMPPSSIIEDDARGLIEKNNAFDINSDGIDFYESLEGMLVRVDNAVAVGPYLCQGSKGNYRCVVPILVDNGTNANLRTPRGGIILQHNDSNPERIFISFLSDTEKKINVGDRFPAPIFGAISYYDNNYRIEVNKTPDVIHNNLSMEVSKKATETEIVIATFNVENFLANKAKNLANYIINNLNEPDIIALEEIADNEGTKESGVDASKNYNSIIKEINNSGGHNYKFINIDPENNKDGGLPGSNIRVGILYRTDRGLKFDGIDGGNATASTKITIDANGPHLSYNPGRIDPLNPVFKNSRKPLAAEFTFRDDKNKLFVIVNHFNSKSGDTPLYGCIQPPLNFSEIQRHKQAEVVNAFVKQILQYDANANVVVLGDLNDFQFSETLSILKGDVLFNTIERLPLNEQYTYNYEGNSQALDHILVSKNIYNNMSTDPDNPDVVHIDSEFADPFSDHDPVVLRIEFPPGR